MSRPSKTGGGPGTNQYKVRGQAKAAERLVCGYSADQVIKRRECVWLRAGFDDIWCLKHRQLAPEVCQLMGLPVCANRLGPRLQEAALATIPIDVVQQWLTQSANPTIRRTAAHQMPPDQLAWATKDKDTEVRWEAAKRVPPDQLSWATKDENEEVRYVAAHRMPADQLTWATKDPYKYVRRVAVYCMHADQLQWATTDEDVCVRRVAAERMPPEQLAWATKDPEVEVRQAAAKRMSSSRR